MTTARVRSIESLPAADPLTGNEVLIGSQAGKTVGVKPSDITTAAAGAAAGLVRASAFPRPGFPNSAGLTLDQRLSFAEVDLREWSGIDFTGNNDSASVFQAACNQAALSGVELVCRVPGTITLGSKIVSHTGKPLRLRSTVEPQIALYNTAGFPTFQPKGSACWLNFAHDGIGIELNRAPDDAYGPGGEDHVYGNQLVGFGTMRQQGDPTQSGWVPRNCGYDVSVRNCGVELDLITLNSTRFVECYNADKSKIKLRGQPLAEGLTALYNYDVIDAELYFWPWWSYHRNVRLYTAFTRTALKTARADGLRAKIFDFQGYITHRVVSVPATTGKVQNLPGGTSYDTSISYLYADSVLGAIQVDAGCDGARCLYGTVIAQPPDAGGLESEPAFLGQQSAPILMISDRALIDVQQFRSAFAGASHVYVTGQNSNVLIGSAAYGSWNRSDLEGSPQSFAGFECAGAATGSKIQIGIMAPIFVGAGNPGQVDGMRRPMPLLGNGATVSARATS